MTIAAVEPGPAPAPAPSPAPPEPAAQDWRLQIPDELRGEKSLAQVKDVGSLARGYVEAQRAMGGRIPIPKPLPEGATPEQQAEHKRVWSEVYAKLGRPETADGYAIGEPEGLPEGVPWDMDGQKEFLAQAHGLGLTKDQALGVLEWYGERVATAFLSQRQEAGKVTEVLKAEWGGAYDRNLAIALRAVDAIGGPKLKEYFNSTGLGNSAELVRAFAKVGKLLAEAQMISGRVEGVLGPEEAKAKIAAVLADQNHPYQAKFAGKPGHREAVEEMKSLHELAYPTTL